MRKKKQNFGEDPQLLQTGRKNKRITPGIRNALIGAVVLVAVSEALLRAGLLPEEGALFLDVAGLLIALGAAAKAV